VLEGKPQEFLFGRKIIDEFEAVKCGKSELREIYLIFLIVL
jgi:hypothetical protein